MNTNDHFSPEYLPEGYMDEGRYVIEVRDEYGWIDHSFSDDLVQITREAKALAPSFPGGRLKLIDRHNQLEIAVA